MKKEKIFTFKKGLKTWPKEIVDYIGKDDPFFKYFKPGEWDCRGKGCCSTTKGSSLAMQRAGASRERTGRSHTLTSAYRCPKHNKAVGGVSNSQHVYGKAIDLKVSGMPPSCVQKMMIDGDFKNGGVGRYNTFSHVDSSTKRIWDERTNKTECANYQTYYIKKPQPPVTQTEEQKKIIELETKVDELGSTLSRVAQELATTKTELAKQEKTNQDLTNTNTQQKVQISDLQKEIKSQKANAIRLEQEVKNLKEILAPYQIEETKDKIIKENNSILKWIKGLLSNIFKNGQNKEN